MQRRGTRWDIPQHRQAIPVPARSANHSACEITQRQLRLIKQSRNRARLSSIVLSLSAQGMGLFDFLKSDQQKIKDQIPVSMEKLKNLIRLCGSEQGPTAALRNLANGAAIIRAGSNYEAFSSVSTSSIMRQDEFERWMIKSTKKLEPSWWADRACYMGMKESGSIVGGPDVPGLWDKEMDDFIAEYYTHIVD